MARPVMLGNGALTVGLNEHGLVHDFYYPYVGLDNLTTARSVHHKIGVWVDNRFSWVDDGSWQMEVDFETDALISNIRMKNPDLEIEIRFQDFVDDDINLFGRQITIVNHAGRPRGIRLFMHQAFQISRAGRADTAIYVPDESYILDYKGRCSLLIYGESGEGQVYDQFAIGNYGIEGKEGTFRDAEDGELSGSPVEHGGVDSVLRFHCRQEAHAESEVSYWIIAADSQYTAEKMHVQVKQQGLKRRLELTREAWRNWLAQGQESLLQIDERYRDMTKKSLLIIKAHTDKRGGIIASCDSSIYNYGRDYYSYVWPRDGAYAIWPLIRLGYYGEAKKFFEFCRDIMHPDGYLMHKYQPDRAIGSTWHPMLYDQRRELAIQEDETASIIYMLGEYYQNAYDDDFVRNIYLTFIQPAANFLAEFLDDDTGLPHASYDLWEEKFLTTTYTTAIVYQALLTAADFAEKFEHPDDAVRWKEVAEQIANNKHVFYDPERSILRKGFIRQSDNSLEFDNTLDVSSLYGAFTFGLERIDNPAIKGTVSLIEQTMLNQSPSGGTPRYEHDRYFESSPPYLGNPWFVTTLWMAQYYARTHHLDKARDLIDWAMEHALPSGVLSEQINPSTGEPVSVTPLVWSHAEFINTALDVAKLSGNT